LSAAAGAAGAAAGAAAALSAGAGAAAGAGAGAGSSFLPQAAKAIANIAANTSDFFICNFLLKSKLQLPVIGYGLYAGKLPKYFPAFIIASSLLPIA
jgi:hypothetical protein